MKYILMLLLYTNVSFAQERLQGTWANETIIKYFTDTLVSSCDESLGDDKFIPYYFTIDHLNKFEIVQRMEQTPIKGTVRYNLKNDTTNLISADGIFKLIKKDSNTLLLVYGSNNIILKKISNRKINGLIENIVEKICLKNKFPNWKQQLIKKYNCDRVAFSANSKFRINNVCLPSVILMSNKNNTYKSTSLGLRIINNQLLFYNEKNILELVIR